MDGLGDRRWWPSREIPFALVNLNLPELGEQEEGEVEEVPAVGHGIPEDLSDDPEEHGGDDLDAGGGDADDDAWGAAHGEKEEEGEDGGDDEMAAEEAEEVAYHPEVEHKHD